MHANLNAALIAAIMASLASKINSIATIFTLDFYAKGKATSESDFLVAGRRLGPMLGRNTRFN